jgi:hypothetical protein
MSMWDYSYPFQYFYTDCPPVKIRQTPKPIDWTKPVREKAPQLWMGAEPTYRSARLLGKLKGSNFSMVAFDNGSHESFLQMTDDEILAKLENTPAKKIVKYLNVYPNGSLVDYHDRGAADNSCMSNRIACIRVELEEGRFDG